MMSGFLGDVRFAARLVAKNPLFFGPAAFLLAIGIGASTLIFSLMNALLLRPLPVADPKSLVRVIEEHPNHFLTWDFPYQVCDAAEAAAFFSEVICQGQTDTSFSDGTVTERVRVHLVSPNFFESLGVHPYLGRVLPAGEDRVAVLSHGFWARRFQRDRSIVGRGIILGGHPFTIAGVSPEGFNGLSVDTSPDIRVAAAADRYLIQPDPGAAPGVRPLFAEIFGRLRNGMPLETANREINAQLSAPYRDAWNQYFPQVKGAAPDAVFQTRLQLESITYGVSTLRGQFSRGLQALMGGVALLLLMACANVAGLLLARSAVRTQEFGIRMALGASRARVMRQVLTEGLLLGLLGGAGGTLLTFACLPLLMRGLPPIRDRGAVLQTLAMHVPVDLRVLGFALGSTLLTVVLFASLPAWRYARAGVARTLRSGRGITGRLLPRNLIVLAQVAMCTLILMAAAMLFETLARMRSMNAGFDRDRVVTFTIDPSLRGHKPDQARAISQAMLEKVRNLPQVASASIASRALMRGTGLKSTLGAAGTRFASADAMNTSLNTVTPEYFKTMGMQVLAGRDFQEVDRSATTPRKAIVNQAFAARFFAARNAVGERIGGAGAGGVAKGDIEIIGVVSDAKYRSLREPVPPTVYYAALDGFDNGFVLHVRTQQRPETMIAPVREALRAVDPEMPLVEVGTLHEEVEASLWQERFLAALSAAFGGIATLLAALGLYGALDHAVKSRTREIGVRIAVGAQPKRIVGLLARDVVPLILGGVALGLCLYALAAVWIQRLTYEVHSWDPVTLMQVSLFVGVVGALAAAPSMYQAVRIDPASALRRE
jgi:predicted permease